jgi:hypothetical protein
MISCETNKVQDALTALIETAKLSSKIYNNDILQEMLLNEFSFFSSKKKTDEVTIPLSKWEDFENHADFIKVAFSECLGKAWSEDEQSTDEGFKKIESSFKKIELRFSKESSTKGEKVLSLQEARNEYHNSRIAIIRLKAARFHVSERMIQGKLNNFIKQKIGSFITQWEHWEKFWGSRIDYNM